MYTEARHDAYSTFDQDNFAKIFSSLTAFSLELWTLQTTTAWQYHAQQPIKLVAEGILKYTFNEQFPRNYLYSLFQKIA